jgi:hypothetical protein
MAELIVFPAFVLLLVIMYYKNKSDVKKNLARMKKPNPKRSVKKKPLGHYDKILSRPKH